jgi:hypothetical protein
MEPSRVPRCFLCRAGSDCLVEVRKSSLGNGFRRAITAAWNGSASILPGGENVRKGREPVLAPAPVIDRALYSGLD